jgi:hypothetical protein
MQNHNFNQGFESLEYQPPLRCRIWLNPMVKVADQPHWTPYTVGVQWRDGMVREGSFSIDEEKLREIQRSNPEASSREALLMHMISQAIEQVFASRDQAKAAVKEGRILVPTRFK